MKLKRAMYSATLIMFVFVFAISSRQVSAVVPQAQRCTAAGTILNTAGCHGYITNTMYWDSTDGITGGPIIYSASQYAIPFTVNSPATLESFISGLLNMSSPTDYSYNYNKSGAAFIVATMLGHIGGGIGDFGNVTNMITYAKQNFTAWSTLVNGYGGTNAGYSIDWGSAGTSISIGTGTVNTMHACPAGTPSLTCQPTSGAAPSGSADSQDFAWYAMASTDGTEITHPITFTSPSGTAYLLRRECGNPIGGPAFPAPPTSPPVTPYTLSPTINNTINGTSPSNNVAQVGDTIVFTYAIDNTSGGNSASVACTTYAQTFAGYHAAVGTGEVLSGAGPGTTCPQVVNAHTDPTIATETVTAATDDTTICRSLYINPYSSTTSGSLGTEDCVTVAAKPYVKVFGGDTLAGAAFASGTGNCTNDSNAQIISWNQESGGYPGSGSQYAALALGAITDFATNQNGSGAGTPSGLAFANTTASGASVFGGSFGTTNYCIPNYYGTMPTSGTTALGASTSVSSLTNGAYTTSSNLQLTGGSVSAGNRVQVFVKGNVYISGNITYAGSWNVARMPLFELVVEGNIYIGSGVTDVDGIYVAQQNGASGGTIYTCATAANTQCDTSQSSYYTTANQKLTVNGSLIANQVQLLRTYGSLNNSSTADTSTSNSAAESINYSPVFWIAQPGVTGTSTSGTSQANQYDAITSLPPIL